MTKSKIELMNFGLDLNDINEYKRISQKFGKVGGMSTLKKHGKEYFKELSKKAAQARKLKKETEEKDLLDKVTDRVDNTNI